MRYIHEAEAYTQEALTDMPYKTVSWDDEDFVHEIHVTKYQRVIILQCSLAWDSRTCMRKEDQKSPGKLKTLMIFTLELEILQLGDQKEGYQKHFANDSLLIGLYFLQNIQSA